MWSLSLFAQRLLYRSVQEILFDVNLVFVHFDIKLLIAILEAQPVLHQTGGFSDQISISFL